MDEPSIKGGARRPSRTRRCRRLAALLVSFASVAVIGACADENTARSGSSVAPSAKGDVVGGDRLDEIYRQIYSPGNPRWSDF